MIERLADGTFRMRLPDGRALAWSARGADDRPTWLWIPGTPSSRFSGPDHALAGAAGVRVVVLERPGFGVSDPRRGRRVIDVAEDVRAVADALDVRELSLAGMSGAGPYLTACAHVLRDRVRRVAFIGVIAPPDLPAVFEGLPAWRRATLALAARSPSVVGLALRAIDPARMLQTMTRDAPPCDRMILERIASEHLHATREALRQGPEAFAWELHLAARPWGVPLSELAVPVDVWHGREDRTTPVAMGRALAAAIPNARLHVIEGEGHFLAYARLAEILAT